MATLTLTPGADIATFGADKDFVIGTLEDLTAIDSIDFGDGGADDVLRLSTAGTVDFRAGGNAAGMRRLERVDLGNGSNTMFLTDALVAASYFGSASVGFFTVRGGTGNDVVGAGLVTTAGSRVQFVLGGNGDDTFVGSNGTDVLRVNANELTAADSLDAGASDSDVMRLDTAGALAADAFANVRRVERIELNAGGNDITVTQAFAASADGGRVTVFSGGGNNTVNATAVTTAMQYFAGSGADTYQGGSGIDTISASVATLSGADVITGGTGSALDVLQLAGGVYAADAFAGVSQIERLLLLAPGSEVFLGLGMPATSTGTFAVIGTAGNDRVVAAAGEAARIGFNPGAGSDRLTGGDGDDQINMTIADLDATDAFNGGEGRDRIGFLSAGTITAAQTAGLTSIETFSLAEGDNTVTLGTNLPTVNVAGRGGRDTVTMGLATQFTSLGGGDDTMIVAASTVPALSSYGGIGTDTIRTTGGGTFTFGELIVEFEQLVVQDGGAIIDLTANLQALTVTGSSGRDTVLVGTIGTVVNAGAGNDTVVNGNGDDVLDGGADFDIFELAPGGGRIDLGLTGPQDTGQGIDTITNFENVRGGVGNDDIIGDANANILHGGAGDDRIFGLAGNDVLWGGAGNDVVDGGTGEDTADYRFLTGTGIVVNLAGAAPQASNDGEGGQDTLIGIENVSGTQYDDVIDGDGNKNRLSGGAGNDILRGAGGDDLIDGGSGDDTMDGGAGAFDTVTYETATAAVNVSLAIAGPQGTGGAGTDRLAGFENLTGSSFDDQLFGDAAANVIRGGNGNDLVVGGAGADQLFGDSGNDQLQDSDTFNVARGGDGDDTGNFSFAPGTLTGTSNSWVQMGNGADTLNLTFSNTTLQTTRAISTGNNTVGTGATPDGIEAGDGNDTVNVNGAFNAAGTYLVTMSGNDTVNMNSGSVFSFVHLGAGNDQYNGGNGADRAFGGAGNDTLNGNSGDDFFDGGLGDDVMAGGSGNDTVSYSATATSSSGGVSVDLAAFAAQDTGGAGIDTLFDIENLVGTAQADTLLGNAQANRLEGGAGDDIIAGRLGADTISTGSGNDQVRWFAANEGDDTLTAWDAGTPSDSFGFLASAFPLFNGQVVGDIRIDNSASGNLAAVNQVVGRSGVASAAAVDAYLAGANQTFAGGVFVLGQAGAGQNVSLYYDANAAVAGGAGSAVLLATIQGVTSLASFSSADFLFFT